MRRQEAVALPHCVVVEVASTQRQHTHGSALFLQDRRARFALLKHSQRMLMSASANRCVHGRQKPQLGGQGIFR